MTDGARVGITTANKNYPVAFSNAYGSNYESSFSSDDADASAEYNTGDQKLYLVAKQYDITVEIEGNGAAFATPARAAANTEITLTATPTADSHFNGWQVVEPQNLTLDGNTFTMPKSTVTVKATFALHSFTAEVAEKQYLKSGATCTEQAEYYKSCAVCGLSSEGTAEEATFFSGNVLDHDWGTWTQNSDEKTHTRICKRDTSHTETENCIDANKDHKCDICDYIISECADDNKDHKCDYCGKKLTEHTGGKATCKDKAKCEVCGAEYGELDAKNHTNLKHFPATAATKTTEGNIEYWYCEGCGKYYSDKDGTKEIKKADTVTAKLKDDSKSPQTGDTSNLALWIALLFVSGGAAIGTTVVSRKKKYNR